MDWDKLTLKEAKKELSTEDYEKWVEYRNQKLRETADKNRERLTDENNDSVEALIQAGKKQLESTLTIEGVKIVVALNISRNVVGKISRLRKKWGTIDPETVSEDDLQKLEDEMIPLLAKVTKNYSESDWRKFTDVNDVEGLNLFAGQIFAHIMSELQNKMAVIEKFR